MTITHQSWSEMVAQRTVLEQELAKYVLEWKQGGLSLHKYGRTLRLAKRIARIYGVSRDHVLDDYLDLTEIELESWVVR